MNLKERGYYVIELSNGETIPLRFTTWTLKRFCEKRGNLPLNQMFEILGGGGGTIDDVIQLVLCAAECKAKEDKKDFNHTDFDACHWIDELGGLGGVKFKEMIEVIAQSTNDESKKKLEAVA